MRELEVFGYYLCSRSKLLKVTKKINISWMWKYVQIQNRDLFSSKMYVNKDSNVSLYSKFLKYIAFMIYNFLCYLESI